MLERIRMHWPYVAFASGTIIALGAALVKMLLARRRYISARESGKTVVEGMDEMACQSGLFVGLLLIAAADLNTVATLRADRSTLVGSTAFAALLILCFGVQLGRLLMRYQLHRLRAVLDTVSGEVVPKTM